MAVKIPWLLSLPHRLDKSSTPGNERISTSVTAATQPYIDGQGLRTLNLRIFSFSKLKKATKNFSLDMFLGYGFEGTSVYKGWLKEGVPSLNSSRSAVAIRRLSCEYVQVCLQVLQVTPVGE